MGAKDDRKATPGVTEWSRPRVHIDGAACYDDVGSPYPGRAEAAKGGGVHPLKRLVSWVQNVVRQFVRYLVGVLASERKDHLVREERWSGASGVPVILQGRPGSYALRG